LVSCSPTLYH